MKKGVRKIELGWRLWSLIICAFILIGVAGFSYATNSSNPAVMGHTANEISGLSQTNAPVGKAIAEYGIVKADGTKLSGSQGWSVSRNSVGHYQLNLSEGEYIVVAGTAPNGVGAPSSIYLSADEIHAFHYANGSFQNKITNNIMTFRQQDGGGFLDCGWNFYAIKI